MLSYLAYIASVLLLPLLIGVESVLYPYRYATLDMFDHSMFILDHLSEITVNLCSLDGKLIEPWLNTLVLQPFDEFPPLLQSGWGKGKRYNGIKVYDWMIRNQQDRELFNEPNFLIMSSDRGEGNAAIEAAKSLKQFEDIIELNTQFFYEAGFPFVAITGVRLAYWTNFIYFEETPQAGFYLEGEWGGPAVTRNDYLISAMGLLHIWVLHEEKLEDNDLPPPVKRSSVGFSLSAESIEIVKKINREAGKTQERVYTVSPTDPSAGSDHFMSLLDLPEAWVVAISLKTQPRMFAANITEITVVQNLDDSDDDSDMEEDSTQYEAEPRLILFRFGRTETTRL